MNKSLLGSLGLLGVVLVAGCGSDDSGGSNSGGSAGGAGGGDRCGAWAAAQCDFDQRCGGGRFFDLPKAVCNERMKLYCDLWLEASPASGAYLECQTVAFAPGPSCDEAAALYDRCSAVKGTLPLGEPCSASHECESGACKSSTSPPSACGTCVTAAGEGESCAELPCRPIFSCDSSKLCHEPPKLTDPKKGEPCYNFDCAAFLRCDHATNLCVELGQEGDPCSTATLECDFSLDCVNGVCTVPTIVGENAACAWGARCSEGLTCTQPQPGAQTCKPIVGDGEACDTSDDERCMYPASCENSVCTVLYNETCQ